MLYHAFEVRFFLQYDFFTRSGAEFATHLKSYL